jgi:hypothetical protein
MPFPRLRPVPLAPIPGVGIRIDIGLRIRRRCSGDDCQSAQAADQSELHQFTSLSTKNCHSFYLVPSTTVKSKRQRTRVRDFSGDAGGKSALTAERSVSLHKEFRV